MYILGKSAVARRDGIGSIGRMGYTWLPNHMLSDKTCILGPFFGRSKEPGQYETFVIDGEEWTCQHNVNGPLSDAQKTELRAYAEAEVAAMKAKRKK